MTHRRVFKLLTDNLFFTILAFEDGNNWLPAPSRDEIRKQRQQQIDGSILRRKPMIMPKIM